MSSQSSQSIVNVSNSNGSTPQLKMEAFSDAEFLRDSDDLLLSDDPTFNPKEEDVSPPTPEVIEPKRPKFPGWAWGLLLLLGAGGLGWLSYTRVAGSGARPQGPGGGGPMPVSLSEPKVAPVQESADYIATLESRGAVTVQSQASGRISQIFVQSGDRVQAGTPLLRLDAQQQQAQVAGAQANIDAANADIVAARADLESARRSLDALQATLASRQSDLTFKQQEYDRFKALQAKGAASLQTLQERRSALDQSKANVSEIQAQISTQKAAIARAQANVVRSQQQKDAAIATANQDKVQLSYFTVNAPIDGVIGDIPAKIGDLVNDSTNLLNLTQNQALEVKIEVPQETVSRLEQGTRVQLLDANDQVIRTGAISFISPEVSPQTQSVQVKAQFSNTGGQLRTNQLIRARLILANRRGLLVPTTAVSRLAGKNFVFVAQRYDVTDCGQQANSPSPPSADQWVAVQKAVELGPIVQNSQEIAQGLNAGDRIITSGLLQLQNCMPIQPNP